MLSGTCLIVFFERTNSPHQFVLSSPGLQAQTEPATCESWLFSGPAFCQREFSIFGGAGPYVSRSEDLWLLKDPPSAMRV